VTFIGATTENPSFEVNSALLSRAQVYVLQILSDEELRILVSRARERVLTHLTFQPAAVDTLVGYADGDARRLLNLLEQADTAAQSSGIESVDAEFLQNALALNARRFDKGGDNFYDQISALHKSVRGSDPDAALYWLCRMLDGGADAKYLSRRLVRMAWEDIGWRTRAPCRWPMMLHPPMSGSGRRKGSLPSPRRQSILQSLPRATRATWPTTRQEPSSRTTSLARCRCICVTRRQNS
jgi:replication-associated recombination protein RarA